MPLLLYLQKYRGKVMEIAKKKEGVFTLFLGEEKIASSWKICVVRHPIA